MDPHSTTYYYLLGANGSVITYVSVEEGERILAELAIPMTAEGLIQQFIEVQGLTGARLAVNRTFLGAVSYCSPETRQFTTDWIAASKKQPWE